MANKTHLAKQEEAVVESGIQQRASDPGSPATNQAWINTSTDELKFFDGATTHTVGSGGGGGGSTSSADVSTQQGQLQKTGLFLNPIKDAFVTNLKNGRFAWTANLIEDYTASTTNIKYVVNPVFLEVGDENTDSDTNWTAVLAATNLTTSATAKVGAASLSFDKDNSNVAALLQLDPTPQLGVSLNTKLYFWVNIPSLTNFDSVRIAIAKETGFTNSAEWDLTTTVSGGAVTTGWNFMVIDLSDTPTNTTGTGWSPSADVIVGFRAGVVTTTSTQTYTAVLLDAFAFADSTGSFYQKGLVLDGYDTSFLDQFQPDDSNTDYQGNITLDASVGQGYTADLSSAGFKLVRTSLDILGDGYARRQTGLSGEVIQTQVLRQRYKLAESVTGATFEKVVGFDTTKVLEVTAINVGVSLEVYDPADWSAEFVNTNSLRVIKVDYSDGQSVFEARTTNPIMDGNATHSVDTTTLPVASTVGVFVGDLIFKDQISERLSVTADAVNESFSAMTLDRIEVVNAGIPYIDTQFLVGHYFLGGFSNEGLINHYGSLANLTENGSVPKNVPFFNRQMAAGPFTTATNWFNLTNAQSAALICDTAGQKVSGHFWLYLNSAIATDYVLVGNHHATQGWAIYIDSGTGGTVSLITNGSDDFAHPTILTTGQWYGVGFALNGPGNTATLWVDTVAQTGTQGATDNTTSALGVGAFSEGSSGFTIGALADLQLWSGSLLTSTKIFPLFNAGNPPKSGSLDSYFLHYTKSSNTGLWVTNESTVTVVTDSDDIKLSNNVIAKTA